MSKVGLLFREPEIPLCGIHSIGGAIWISLSSFHFLIHCSRLCGTLFGGATRAPSLFFFKKKSLTFFSDTPTFLRVLVLPSLLSYFFSFAILGLPCAQLFWMLLSFPPARIEMCEQYFSFVWRMCSRGGGDALLPPGTIAHATGSNHFRFSI